jgi:hypothetical protein
MSIFKSTFKPYVIRQINTRQNLLSEINRPVDFNQYVSGKVPWIKMTSLVDYAENGKDSSSALAKKYVLMGGTLYNKSGTNDYYTRAGVGGANASYGGNLGTNQYGIRPMPGITSLKTRSLGAYGSLSEATIKFQAWDVKQLEDLSILFLRPGYKVLLEWGWSMYLDTRINGEDYKSKATTNALKDSNTYSIRPSVFKTIDCFDPSITQESLYDQINKYRHALSGNYDGVLGSIMNFNYTLMPNGGYECTTVLISIGDAIDTIRMNDTLGISVNEFSNPNQQTQTPVPVTQDNADIKSQFELLMDAYCKLDNNNPRKDNIVISAIDEAIKPKDKSTIDPFIYNYKDRSNVESFFADSNNINFSQVLSNQVFTTAPVNNGTLIDKRSYYYIQFAYLLHILNVFKNVFADREQKLVDIEIPPNNPKNSDYISNGLCQASFNSISIDPNTAVIRNSKATLFTDTFGVKGFRPEIYKTETPALTAPIPVSSYLDMPEFLYGDTNFGIIGNVYINIKEAINIYQQQIVSNKGYVYVGKYINDILDKVSFSLGSINDFDKFIQDDKIVIIDRHYTELPEDSKYTSKYKINVSGNNSIVRNHKIESKIFPSQASMIAIAAQDKENIGALQTSTYNYLNKGLVDRLLGNKVTSNKDIELLEEEARKNKLDAILNLIQFVNNYVVPNSSIGAYYATNVGTMNGYLNTLLVEMEGGTDYKAIVPISVDLTTDGFSGLTIGEIFTVDKKVLPKDYENKAVGFIVIGISNEVATNGWTTNLSSQMCLLDQDERQVATRAKAEKLLGELQDRTRYLTINNIAAAQVFNILAALVVDVVMGKLKVTSIEGVVEIDKKAKLYTKAAVLDMYPDSFESALEDLFQNFQDTYKLLYPKQDADGLSTPLENEGSKILSYGTEYSFPDYKVVYYNEKNRKKIISKTTGLPADYSEYRVTNIKNREVLISIIKNMDQWYPYLESLKPAFNDEYYSFISAVPNVKPTGFKSLFSADTDLLTAKDFVGKRVKVEAIFDILDITKVTDSTGLFVTPLPFIKGYKYTS